MKNYLSNLDLHSYVSGTDSTGLVKDSFIFSLVLSLLSIVWSQVFSFIYSGETEFMFREVVYTFFTILFSLFIFITLILLIYRYFTSRFSKNKLSQLFTIAPFILVAIIIAITVYYGL